MPTPFRSSTTQIANGQSRSSCTVTWLDPLDRPTGVSNFERSKAFDAFVSVGRIVANGLARVKGRCTAAAGRGSSAAQVDRAIRRRSCKSADSPIDARGPSSSRRVGWSDVSWSRRRAGSGRTAAPEHSGARRARRADPVEVPVRGSRVEAEWARRSSCESVGW